MNNFAKFLSREYPELCVSGSSREITKTPSKRGGRSVTEARITVYLPVDFALILELTVLALFAVVLNLQLFARLVQHVL